MNTRERLIEAASELFAERGYAGASVRDICNLARANPGAVSYHFGGKRQLYRTVLRTAAEKLAVVVPQPSDDPAPDERPTDVLEFANGLVKRLDADPVSIQLLLRDLADGGSLAAEALEPRLRAAIDVLQTEYGSTDVPRTTAEVGVLFLQLAAAAVLAAVAWPVVARPLGLHDTDRQRVLTELARRSLPTDR